MLWKVHDLAEGFAAEPQASRLKEGGGGRGRADITAGASGSYITVDCLPLGTACVLAPPSYYWKSIVAYA